VTARGDALSGFKIGAIASGATVRGDRPLPLLPPLAIGLSTAELVPAPPMEEVVVVTEPRGVRSGCKRAEFTRD
jgi:hypothetical protein